MVVNTELNGQMRVYRWDERPGTLEGGQLVDPSLPDYKAAKSAVELECSQNGKFLYLSLRAGEDKLLACRCNAAEGTLAEIQRIASSGRTPWSFGLDPPGKWLLVPNAASGTVSVFPVNGSTGKLAPAGESSKLQGVVTVGFLAR